MRLIDDLRMRWKYRGQEQIATSEGDQLPASYKPYYYTEAFNRIEVVSRGASLITDSVAEINLSIQGRLPDPRTVDPRTGKPLHVREKLLKQRLNFLPNPNENVEEYRRQLTMDMILNGNEFQYWDGLYLWHLPAKMMEVVPAKGGIKKVKEYIFDGNVRYDSTEIIHVKDNSSESIYTGQSRLRAASNSIRVLDKMINFQEIFFDNGATPGLLLVTENILGKRMKDRMIAELKSMYGPTKKGKAPMILDGNLQPHALSNQSFKELDFEASVGMHEKKILKALGVPPILLDAGNNSNITPNIRLFYEETVIPLASKRVAAYEAFFGFDLEPDLFKVRAMKPELQDASNFYSSMVNNGIITINEAREELRREPSSEPHANELRIPANIAGSATDPSQGGRPPEEEEETE